MECLMVFNSCRQAVSLVVLCTFSEVLIALRSLHAG